MSDKSLTVIESTLMPAIGEGLRHILTQQTPTDAVKKRKGKGGKTFSYVEHAWVTEQLNTAFNWGWSWEITEWHILPAPNDPVEVFVLGRLTVHTPDGAIVKMQFGTQDIKRDKQGNILSIGDDLKAASSDGLKKAASLLGLALDLYKSGDDEGHTVSDDPMTAYWAAAKAKGLTQAEGTALLTKHKSNPDRALKELTKEPAPNGNEVKIAEMKRAQLDFYARVGKEIPYFGKDSAAIGKTLQSLGFTAYSQAKEAEMLTALQAHANEAANEEAAT